MDHARRAENAQAMRDLESIAPYAEGARPIALEDLYLQRNQYTMKQAADFQVA